MGVTVVPEYKRGDNVQCVDADGYAEGVLTLGQVYKIVDIDPREEGRTLYLKVDDGNQSTFWWLANRFTPWFATRPEKPKSIDSAPPKFWDSRRVVFIPYINNKVYEMWGGEVSNIAFFNSREEAKNLGFNDVREVTLWEWKNRAD